MGRRKIKMEKMENTNTKQVTFSKRRSGLFKKASELATLCNAEVGIVVFSPGNKPYSFGKPSFDVVADRFKRKSEESDDTSKSCSRRKRVKVDEISKRLNSIVEETEAEKQKGEKLQLLFDAGGDKRFMKSDEEFTVKELKELKGKLESKLCAIEENLDQMLGLDFLMCLSKGKPFQNS